MTVEEFREQAIKNGTFEKLKTQNVVLTLKDNIKATGFLNFLRKVFPDNYIGKEGRKYTIYCGDKETAKILNTPIHFYNQNDAKKGSNNRYKTISKIRKEYNHITNKKNDISNKIVSSILKENKVVVIQDEQIDSWKEGEFACSKIQHSVLGRIKSKLSQSDRVIILDKWFPTTKYCSNCGHKYDDIKLNERIFICPVCKKKEDRDIHASKNMIYFYQEYNKLDRSGMDQTSIKGPVKISYNKFVSKISKQEDITL